MSELHHLAAAYALDALDAEERRAFEAHYPTCEICAQEVADFREVAASLAETTSEAPPENLKASVMAEITRTRQISPIVPDRTKQRSFASPKWLAAAAALILVAGVAVIALRPADPDTVAELVSAPDAIVTTRDPAADSPAGRLQVVWSGDRDQVAVIGSDLAAVSADLAYALWFLLADGTVAPAALFQPDDGSFNDVLAVADLEPVGWGVTVEPVSGSEQPTTPVIFAGNL